MELLKTIEDSEKNNPLLTAALQEIGHLNNIINEAKDILDATTDNTTYQIDSGAPYHPTFNQLNDTKVDMLSNLLFN
jgi:hypothetical protein